MRRFLIPLFFVTLTSFQVSAHAGSPGVEISGFGSVGARRASSTSYYLSPYNTTGQTIDYADETRIGVNLRSNLGRGWTVASQFLAAPQSGAYGVVLDWGMLSYQPIPELALRAGRLVAPTWLFSQQINVGYSYLWIRPPVEVYSLLSGLYSVTGASALANFRGGDGTFTAELYGGGQDTRFYQNNLTTNSSKTESSYTISSAVGLDLAYTFRDILTLHASYLQARVSGSIQSSLNVTAPVVNATIPGLTTSILTPIDTEFGQFFSFGEKLDYENVILIGEFARRLLSGQAFPSASAWYATLGYQIKRVTPYFTYSWLGGLEGNMYTHPAYPAVTSLQTSQTAYQVGANIQVHDSVVLKAEVQPTHFTYADPTKNFWTQLYSASASFIF